MADAVVTVGKGLNVSRGFAAMCQLMAGYGWRAAVDGSEMLYADNNSVRAIYTREQGVWIIECADPFADELRILAVRIGRDSTFGAIRMVMEHMRMMAQLKAR